MSQEAKDGPVLDRPGQRQPWIASRKDSSGQRPVRNAVTSLIGLIGISTRPDG